MTSENGEKGKIFRQNLRSQILGNVLFFALNLGRLLPARTDNFEPDGLIQNKASLFVSKHMLTYFACLFLPRCLNFTEG